LIAGVARSPAPPPEPHFTNPQLRAITDLSSNVSPVNVGCVTGISAPASGQPAEKITENIGCIYPRQTTMLYSAHGVDMIIVQ
jgi:hypothetical protein